MGQNESQPGSVNLAFKYISKRDCIVILTIAGIVLVVGLILIALGYNEGFYVEDPAVRGIFSIFTEVGGEMAYVVLLALLLFAVDWKLGKALFTQFMINSFLNNLLKDIYKDPRPKWNIVDGEPIEDSFGFPSGHSQNAMGFWGYLFLWKKNTEPKNIPNLILFAISGFFLIVLPISRLILGVHDLDDVVGGTVIGLVILVLFLLIFPFLEPVKQKPIGLRIMIGVIPVIIAWLIVVLAVPEGAEGVGQACGLLLAAAIGFPLEEKYIDYDPLRYSRGQRVLAGIVGLLITFIFYFGLGALFGLFPEELGWILRFVRYFLIGIILLLVVPIVIKKVIKNQ